MSDWLFYAIIGIPVWLFLGALIKGAFEVGSTQRELRSRYPDLNFQAAQRKRQQDDYAAWRESHHARAKRRNPGVPGQPKG